MKSKRKLSSIAHQPFPEKKVPEAVEKRANDNEWDIAERLCRNEMALAVRSLRNFYRTNPLSEEWGRSAELRLLYAGCMIHIAKGMMRKCLDDCRVIDEKLVFIGQEPVYSTGFATSFNSKKALFWLHSQSFEEFNKMINGGESYYDEIIAGNHDLAKAKFAISEFRETLRDGYSVEFALELHADSIKNMLRRNSAAFFVDLGTTISKHQSDAENYKRTLSNWLRRAWLPLRLWELPANGIEAWETCRLFARLLEIPAPKNGIYTREKFLNIWHKIKPKYPKEPKPDSAITEASLAKS